MTIQELTQEVADRLNLTSDDAFLRIESRINDRHRRVCSAVGLETSRRVELNYIIDPSDTMRWPDLPDFDLDLEKVLRIRLVTESTRPKILPEVTYDEVTSGPLVSRLPQAWANKRLDAESVTITVDCFPDTDPFTLRIEGIDNGSVLSGDEAPGFPADFHDILVEGAMSDELRKMEKAQLAQIAESNYMNRLSDLRMFIAKSAYKTTFAGKTGNPGYWNNNFFSLYPFNYR